MAQPIYFTDPAVAAAYHVHPGEFATVADDAEAAWLVENFHGYDLAATGTPPPAAYYVHPQAPNPFVPYAIATAPPPPEPPAPPPPEPPPPEPPPPAPEPAPAPAPPPPTASRKGPA
jgi:hypothetical protein